jgi:three-Cys-motif partner protein
MGSKDLHENDFDDTTNDKLRLFSDYLREWLPVFLAREKVLWRTLHLVDFFAGPGRDKQGQPGSPELIFSRLSDYSSFIESRNFNINVLLNEFKKDKHDQLLKLVQEKQQQFPKYKIETENLDFNLAFDKWYSRLNDPGAANMLFLDQNGIKHMNQNVFSKISALQQTDFLFFVSSAHARRFFDHESIRQYLQLKKADIERTHYYHIHRLVHEHIKSWVPENREYYLGRFSLRKSNGNIYGLIFGSGHVLGMEKFLRSCWKLDPERGEANYDIDKDNLVPGQGNLFTGEIEKSKKLEEFEIAFAELIVNKTLSDDKSIYLYCITNGFLPKHANAVLDKLVKKRVIKKAQLNITHKVCKPGAVIHNLHYI